MAMTEDEEGKLKAELAQTKEALTSALAQQQTQANEAKEAEAKRAAKGKGAGKVEIDPDIAKEVAELKGKVAELEKALGSKGKGGGLFSTPFNLFGE